MSLIVSKDGKDAKKLQPSSFNQEDYLQQYIYNNPDVVPIDEIDEDLRLLILARELMTQSGPIDAFGVDQYGNIYIIETKLYKNPDKRRVVAQVLDYGASLWSDSLDFANFLLQLDSHTQSQFSMTTSEKLQDFFGIDQNSADIIITNIERGLNEGSFRFVVLMDSLHKQLKDLIAFLNRNSQFDIYAVELEYYKYNRHEIILPRMFGAEIKKGIPSRLPGKQKETNQWLINTIKTLALPPHIHIDYPGASPRYLRFTTDAIDSILPQRTTNDGGWNNGRSCMYEIYCDNGFGSAVQIHLELNRDNISEEEEVIHEKIISFHERSKDQYHHWFRGRRWKVAYTDEDGLKSGIMRIFTHELPEFEHKLLTEVNDEHPAT